MQKVLMLLFILSPAFFSFAIFRCKLFQKRNADEKQVKKTNAFLTAVIFKKRRFIFVFMETTTKKLRRLVTLETININGWRRGLRFYNTMEIAFATPIECPKFIIWPSKHFPNTVEDNAPTNADSYEFCCGEPRRGFLGYKKREKVAIQYYRLAR